MDRAKVVEFNQARGLIKRTDRADQLDPYLVEDQPRLARWSTYYLGLTLVGTLAYGVSSAVGPAQLSSVVVVGFIVSVAGLSMLQRGLETDAGWANAASDLVASVFESERVAD